MAGKTGKTLRVLAIVMLGLTAAFTLLGGAGTTCVAFFADTYGPAFAGFVPNMPMYQIFVYVCIAAGIAGLAVTWLMVRGRRRAFTWAIVVILLSGVMAAVQMYYSSVIKGVPFFQTPPSSMRLYCAILTLVIFIVLKLPGIREKVDFTAPWRGTDASNIAGGMAAFVAGVLIITTPSWAGPSHMLNGDNLVNVLLVPLLIIGGALISGGIGLLSLVVTGLTRRQASTRVRARITTVWQAAVSR
jgi:hypothetical protein